MTTNDRPEANQEPIVIRQGRLKLWSMCLLSAAFVGAALLVPPSHVHGATIHLAIGFFGLCAVVLGLQALSPGTLTLSPAGLVQRSLFRTVAFQWSDFDGFRVRQLRRSAMVVGDLSEAGRAKLGWRRFLGRTGNLGGLWELPPQRVVDQLNEALARWRPPN